MTERFSTRFLRLHQVREGVANEAPYDLAFIGGALVILTVGLALIWRAKLR